MEVQADETGKRKYTTPRWVQVWFLARSRKRWKEKHGDLKVEARRLQRQVSDVTKSREKWREEALQLRQRIRELERQDTAAGERTAALKKCGSGSGPGS